MVMIFGTGVVHASSIVGSTTDTGYFVSVTPKSMVDGAPMPTKAPDGGTLTSTTVNGRPAVVTTEPYCYPGAGSPACTGTNPVRVPQVRVSIDFGATVGNVGNVGNVDQAAVLDLAAGLTNLYSDDVTAWRTSPLG
jgi:hypothetical protein